MCNLRFIGVNKTLGFISILIVQLKSPFGRYEFQSMNLNAGKLKILAWKRCSWIQIDDRWNFTSIAKFFHMFA